MKRFLALAILVASFAATAAEPPCWPRQLGSTGSDFKQGATPDGQWMGWTCEVDGKPQVFGMYALAEYKVKHPDVTGLSPSKAASAYWTANVTADSDPRLIRLRAAMVAGMK
jgi:hypothetical protein